MTFGSDAVEFEWNGSGTGAVIAGVALTHRRTPPANDNGAVEYFIRHTTVNQWERGEGSWNDSGQMLSRFIVKAGSNGTSLVNFAVGLKIVAWVLGAEAATATRDGLMTAAARAVSLIATPDIKTGAYTASVGERVLTSTASGSFNASLPPSPVHGNMVAFYDADDSWSTNALVVLRNGQTITGLAEDINATGGKDIVLLFSNGTWRFVHTGGGVIANSLGAAPVNLNGYALVNYISPHVPNVSGLLSQALHGGRPCEIIGPVIIPVDDGFSALLCNESGITQTVTPASGGLIYDGVIVGSLGLPHQRELSVRSNGTNVWTAGAVA